MDTIEKKNTAKEAMQSIVECLNDGTEKAIQIITIQSVTESERKLFAKIFIHWMHKNKKKVYLIAENKESLQKVMRIVETKYRGMKIVGTATWEEQGVSNDNILNLINGAEAESIIATLPQELEEAFTSQNRLSLDAKVWFGIGTEKDWKEEKSFAEKMKELISNVKQKK